MQVLLLLLALDWRGRHMTELDCQSNARQRNHRSASGQAKLQFWFDSVFLKTLVLVIPKTITALFIR